MPQDMGTSLTLVDASQLQVSSHYTITLVVRLRESEALSFINGGRYFSKGSNQNSLKIVRKGIDKNGFLVYCHNNITLELHHNETNV